MSASSSIPAIVRAALLEMRRRRDTAVLLLFLAVLLLFLAAARLAGIDSPSAATFLLNLSLTLVTLTAQLITLLSAARHFPDELERRTLYPLLARPVPRAALLLGKYASSLAAGLLVLLLMLGPVLLLVPRMEPLHTATLLQALLLQPAALAMTAAIALCLSLLLPRVLAVFLSLLLTFFVSFLTRPPLTAPLRHILPDPSRLSLVLRYTDGIAPLPPSAWLSLFAAGLLWSLLFLSLAIRVFNRKSL